MIGLWCAFKVNKYVAL